MHDALFPPGLGSPRSEDGFNDRMKEYFSSSVAPDRKQEVLSLFRQLLPEGETQEWERERLLEDVIRIPEGKEELIVQLVQRVMQRAEVRAAWIYAETITDVLRIPEEYRELAVKRYEELQTKDPHEFGKIAQSYLPPTRSSSPVLVDDFEEAKADGWDWVDP